MDCIKNLPTNNPVNTGCGTGTTTQRPVNKQWCGTKAEDLRQVVENIAKQAINKAKESYGFNQKH